MVVPLGQLDEEALFYLQSRDSKKEARHFDDTLAANNVLESVELPILKRRINILIAKKIGE